MDALARAERPLLERGDGAAEIGFAVRAGRTRLRHLYQRAPCRVLSPVAEPGEPLEAVLVTTSGGLADGDRLRFALDAHEGACAQVTTQAAEKVYRAQGADTASIDVAIAIGSGAWLEWLPQETILFDGARLVRRTRADLAPGARLLACEHVVFGRVSRGERFAFGSLLDRWEIRRDDRLAWRDALELADDMAAVRDAPWGFAGAEAFATALYVADDGAGLVEAARSIAEGTAPVGARAGATVVNGVVLARWLGGAHAVRAALAGFVAEFRAAAGGYRAAPPRIWTM